MTLTLFKCLHLSTTAYPLNAHVVHPPHFPSQVPAPSSPTSSMVTTPSLQLCLTASVPRQLLCFYCYRSASKGNLAKSASEAIWRNQPQRPPGEISLKGASGEISLKGPSGEISLKGPPGKPATSACWHAWKCTPHLELRPAMVKGRQLERLLSTKGTFR